MRISNRVNGNISMGSQYKHWIIKEFIMYVKSNYPQYKIEEEMGRLYLTNGKKDCIELLKPNLTLTSYTHSSAECKKIKKHLEEILLMLGVGWEYLKPH